MDESSIVKLAEAYSAHCNLKLSTLGVYAANDGKLFSRLNEGGSCTLNTATKILAYFDTHWPTDLKWPEALIPRPSKKKEAA